MMSTHKKCTKYDFLAPLTQKKLGRGRGQVDPPCGFSKKVSSEERVKP